jgi:hypothetical protein
MKRPPPDAGNALTHGGSSRSVPMAAAQVSDDFGKMARLGAFHCIAPETRHLCQPRTTRARRRVGCAGLCVALHASTHTHRPSARFRIRCIARPDTRALCVGACNAIQMDCIARPQTHTRQPHRPGGRAQCSIGTEVLPTWAKPGHVPHGALCRIGWRAGVRCVDRPGTGALQSHRPMSPRGCCCVRPKVYGRTAGSSRTGRSGPEQRRHRRPRGVHQGRDGAPSVTLTPAVPRSPPW